ncbi:MAG TPA: peptidoglycan DD-metalloendopeptidase family protein [Oscillospiraceae bacterium]|nr:peptidoglycan DD-metalloendopeptidase family protein [Oscillospiraceae bacterium]
MLIGKKIGKAAAAVVLAAALAFAPGMFSAPVQAASSIDQLQSKQAALKKQQADVAAKLKTLQADKTQKVAYRDALTAQMNNVEGQIDNYNAQITTLNANIKAKTAEIATKQVTIQQNFDKLKERIKALYLMGEASNLEIILNAKNVTDFADKAEMLHAISKHDTQLINTLKTEMKAVQTQKAAIEASRTQVASAKTALETKSDELDALVKDAKAVVTQISADESAANAQKSSLTKQMDATNAAIDQWYKNYYASQTSSTSGSGGYSSTGNFVWPVPGFNYISSYYGEVVDRSKPHPGVDIAGHGIYGAKILAADSGRVIQTTSGWGGGYGNSVYIDHGNGYSTRYGHCSSICVSVGQQVTRGQVIGYVGSTGDSTGPHCHFEIRVNGATRNPLSYFK